MNIKYWTALLKHGTISAFKGDRSWFEKCIYTTSDCVLLCDFDNLYNIFNKTLSLNETLLNIRDIHSYDNKIYTLSEFGLHNISNTYSVIQYIRNTNGFFLYNSLFYECDKMLYKMKLDNFYKYKICYIYSKYDILYDYALDTVNIIKVFKYKSTLTVMINNDILHFDMTGHKYKSIDKVYLIDNNRFLIQLQSNCHPYNYRKWYLYYSNGDFIIKNLPNIIYFKFMTINQSYVVCLKFMFYILDTSALDYIFLNGSFESIIPKIDNEEFIYSMYFSHDKHFPQISLYEDFILYMNNSHVCLTSTQYPFNLNMKYIDFNVQSLFFTDTKIFINGYHGLKQLTF